MRRRARSSWNDELARVEVSGGSDLDTRSFYTALYHSQLHPNVFSDVDGRYRGFDDQIHDAGRRTHYANFSLWDLYKSQNQLLALIQPERYREMLLSLLADLPRRRGKLPRWGEQNIDAAHMSGDPAIPTIADGVCRGLLDREPRRGALRAGARPAPAAARRSSTGSATCPMSPGTTLEYGVADFALALRRRRARPTATTPGAGWATRFATATSSIPRRAGSGPAQRRRELALALRPHRRDRLPGGQLVAVLVARAPRRPRPVRPDGRRRARSIERLDELFRLPARGAEPG